ncbi:MAG: VanW family protein [Clostridiales bacterium]|jgi:vancomycin resistance protein YoaR|nr:VanW family protein [Clostridiales bacterium]
MSTARKQKQKPANTGGALVKIIMALSALAVAACATLGFMSYEVYQQMLGIVNADTIYKNIFVNGIDVGGLSKEQALGKLEQAFQPELRARTIIIADGRREKILRFEDFDARYDFTEAVDIAYNYARLETLRERYGKITALNAEPYKLTVEPQYSFEAGNIRGYVDTLAEELYEPPADADITRKDGRFIITDSHIGRRMDPEKTAEGVFALLKARQGGVAAAVMEELPPVYTAEDMRKAQSLIGTFSTNFSGGESERNMNIFTACAKINDTVVYPGEIFSTNDAFGEMTYANGYRPAPTIVGGKLVDDLGGGVCQVSSTLYNALLYAELEIVERQNHSMKVGYLDYGYDATLAGNYIDLKFCNNTNLPVCLEGKILDGHTVQVNVYGYQERPPGHRLVFQNELVEVVPPGDDLLVEDTTLPMGQRVVEKQARTGYRYNLYKIVYEGDVEVARTLVNKSYYRPVKAEVRVGAAPEDTMLGMLE